MDTFFAVATLAHFDDLRREIGYLRALRVLDDLCEELQRALPPLTIARANRTNVEFVLHAMGDDEALTVLHELHERIGGEVLLRRRRFTRTLVIGAVRCPTAHISPAMVERAEQALAQAQALHPAIRMIEPSDGASHDDLLMEELRRTIRGDGLALLYQPKLGTRDGELRGAEALVRWPHPTRGMISPVEFIPIAERSGDIRALTDWVIRRAVADGVRLEQAGIACRLHVNISAPLIASAEFVDSALALLGRRAASIGFEITETAMMADPDGTLANLERLAAAGIALSIDDYGSGFSSLAYLQRLPVAEIKVDQIFISRLASGSRDPLLVRSTIDLAHAMEMMVTAEGVEAPAALALLQVMGCDMVQGFLLSRPLPFDDLLAFAQHPRDKATMAAVSGDARWAKLARQATR